MLKLKTMYCPIFPMLKIMTRQTFFGLLQFNKFYQTFYVLDYRLVYLKFKIRGHYLSGLWWSPEIKYDCFHWKNILLNTFKEVYVVIYMYFPFFVVIDDITVTADGTDTYHLVKAAGKYK